MAAPICRFQHVPEAKLREAFGPVIDRLAANGIDLTKMPVEVAPIAHYHMGGVAADVRMQTEVPGLLVAGEAVGGANGANRLSGNAITEALVFGRQAGRSAAARAKAMPCGTLGRRRKPPIDLMRSAPREGHARTRREMIQTPAGRPWPTTSGRCAPRTSLKRALRHDRRTGRRRSASVRSAMPAQFDMQRLDWFDLRNMLTVARAVTQAALLRTESRGAHQREDFPEMLPQWRVNQTIRLRDDRLDIAQAPASRNRGRRAMSETATLKIWRGADRRPRRVGKPTPCRSSAASRCSTGCAGSAPTRDPSLAIRFSCINANACKECMMELDGETVYACTARLEPREMRLTPLSNKKLVRDLVTEIAPPAERFGAKEK